MSFDFLLNEACTKFSTNIYAYAYTYTYTSTLPGIGVINKGIKTEI